MVNKRCEKFLMNATILWDRGWNGTADIVVVDGL